MGNCKIGNSAHNKLYRKKNAERINAQRRAYRRSDAYKQWLERTSIERNAKVSARARIRKETSIEAWLKKCLIACRSRHRKCTITLSDLMALWTAQSGICAVSNLPMNHLTNSLSSVSVDRKDSAVDYSADNVHLVARWVNIGKGNRPTQEIIDIVSAIRASRSPRNRSGTK